MDDPHAPLRRDVRMLGDLLGRVLREQEGQEFYDLVEQVRKAAKSARKEGFATAGLDVLDTVDAATAGKLARAFGAFLSLANIAEQQHRVRRRRDHHRAGSEPQRGSIDETFTRLAATVAPEKLRQAVMELRIDLVLTAHPTEATRRTLIMNQQRIAALLERLDRIDLLTEERSAAQRALHGEVLGLWLTEGVRRTRPTPEQEARAGLAVIERVLWQAIPKYLREVDTRLRATTSGGLPPEAAPIRFGSWIGGDRDGNPFVTPTVTKRVILLSRWMGLQLYLQDVDVLRERLSIQLATPEFIELAGPGQEPYRRVLRTLRGRLASALEATEVELDGGPEADPLTAADIEKPLRACYDSLHASGAGILADGDLLDTLRRLATFDLHLVRLDVRQDSRKHFEAIDGLTNGRYAKMTEPERQEFLLAELSQPPEPLPAGDDVLDLFHLLAKTDRAALGSYVISMASTATDMLAVAYLQHRAGLVQPLQVVPLFETPKDLETAPDVIEQLLADSDASAPFIQDGLQVMIGYSDSAKEAGMLAAAWALYQAQERITKICSARNVGVTFFHGRGGTVSRGGGPAHQAILALPPGSVGGRLRVTEQGEVIQARFGLPGIALRTLELYTTATLEATLNPGPPPDPTWSTAMDRIASRAKAGFRSVINDPEFPDFFGQVTPVRELDHLNIGSRPAKRGSGTAPGSLRAIPWVFAWTQNRLILPAWLGADHALTEPRPNMESWPFWSTTIDLLEMALAKADDAVFAHYNEELGEGGMGTKLLTRLAEARRQVLTAAGHAELLADSPVIQRSIKVRNPYLDPIHLLQVRLLRRVRAGEEETLPALLETMTGIAAGMRNTG